MGNPLKFQTPQNWKICRRMTIRLLPHNSPSMQSVVPEKYSYPTTKRISLITLPRPHSLLDFPFLQGNDDPNTHPSGISTSVVKTPQPLLRGKVIKSIQSKEPIGNIFGKIR